MGTAGTRDLIYLNGEEARPPFGTVYGQAWAHIVTGPGNGQTYELNDLGEMSFENVVASPFPQRKTIVVGLDDSTNRFTGGTPPADANNPPSEVYVYIGEKQRSGNPVQRAGLTGGDLFGIKVPGHPTEATITGGERFSLHLMSDAAQDDGFVLQSESISNAVTQFRRVEDGQWDPTHRNDFYFVDDRPVRRHDAPVAARLRRRPTPGARWRDRDRDRLSAGRGRRDVRQHDDRLARPRAHQRGPGEQRLPAKIWALRPGRAAT